MHKCALAKLPFFSTISQKRFKYSPSFDHKTYHSAKLYHHSASSYITANSLRSIKVVHSSSRLLPLRRTPVSNDVRIRTHSLIPNPKATIIGLGARLVPT